MSEFASHSFWGWFKIVGFFPAGLRPYGKERAASQAGLESMSAIICFRRKPGRVEYTYTGGKGEDGGKAKVIIRNNKLAIFPFLFFSFSLEHFPEELALTGKREEEEGERRFLCHFSLSFALRRAAK